jgi:hypothetical protein
MTIYEIFEIFEQHLLTHPICEMRYPYPCDKKAVTICRWGTIRSACEECAAHELKSYYDEVDRIKANEESY